MLQLIRFLRKVNEKHHPSLTSAQGSEGCPRIEIHTFGVLLYSKLTLLAVWILLELHNGEHKIMEVLTVFAEAVTSVGYNVQKAEAWCGLIIRWNFKLTGYQL